MGIAVGFGTQSMVKDFFNGFIILLENQIRESAAVLRQDPVYGPKIIEDLDLARVENWADSAVIIRCRIKCVPQEQWKVHREFLRRLKDGSVPAATQGMMSGCMLRLLSSAPG